MEAAADKDALLVFGEFDVVMLGLAVEGLLVLLGVDDTGDEVELGDGFEEVGCGV